MPLPPGSLAVRDGSSTSTVFPGRPEWPRSGSATGGRTGRLRAGQPVLPTGPDGDPPIQTGGQLDRHPGRPVVTCLANGLRILSQRSFKTPEITSIPASANRVAPPPDTVGLGVKAADENPSYPGFDDSLAARRGPTLVIARFQGDVQIRPLARSPAWSRAIGSAWGAPAYLCQP